MRTVLLLSLLSLSGCALGPRTTETRVAESAWQTLNAVDFATTVNIARAPGQYSEEDPLTRAAIGAHPTQKAVYEYWAAFSTVHYLVSGWLDRHDGTGWDIARKGWYALTIGQSAYNVGHNLSIGLRPFGGAPRTFVVNCSGSNQPAICSKFIP